MCAVSNIGDYGAQTWPSPYKLPQFPYVPPKDPIEDYADMLKRNQTVVTLPYNGPTKEQFEEFLELLRAARKFDVATGQADCPAESKTAWMREMAKLVGVDPAKVDEILKAK